MNVSTGNNTHSIPVKGGFAADAEHLTAALCPGNTDTALGIGAELGILGNELGGGEVIFITGMSCITVLTTDN
jgi:hypothetical protein